MPQFSRRKFLKYLAAGLGSIYLAACLDQSKLISRPSTAGKASPTPFIPDPTATQSPTAEETQAQEPTESPETTAIPSLPDLVVARQGEPEEMVRAALQALGGMEKFVSPGDVVVVKPNICVAYHSFEYAATTNPWVVGAVVKLALEAGAKQVKVMDFPFGGTGEQAYQASGIKARVESAGGKMVVMSKIKYLETDIPQGQSLRSAKIYDDVLRADVLINVPIAKHHSLARLTLGMKNLMGVIRDRGRLHSNLGQNLADLNSRVRSNLVIVDAVRMLMDHGPSGGNLADVRKADTIIASPDVVAADSYAATLFGVDPNSLGYIKQGAKMGLGVKNLDKLKIEEISFG